MSGVIQCPDCGAASVTRSHRRHVFERLIGPFARPYRCHNCGRRFFARSDVPRISARMLLGPATGVLLAVAVILAVALWPLRAEIYRIAPADLQPGPLILCLFLSILIACALMLTGVVYSARRKALDDLNRRLRRLEAASADGSELEQKLRTELDHVLDELRTVRADLTIVQQALGSEFAGSPEAPFEVESSIEPDPPVTTEENFDPVRETHVEALDALHRAALTDAETLLLRALRLCDERNQSDLARGIIGYDLARVLALEGDSDVLHRNERYARALDQLRASLPATGGEIRFKFLCDLETGGAFHQLSLQPDLEHNVNELLSLIEVA